MGFLDALLGGGRKLKAPAPDRLFAMSTAEVTLSTGLGLTHRGAAGIVFQPLATADFAQMLAQAEELLHGAAGDTGTTVETTNDEFGYRWIVLRDDDFDDLVVALNTVSGELTAAGYGDRLLCCVFGFNRSGEGAAVAGGPVYFIYNFKRGLFYPFVPSGKNERDLEEELRLMAQLGGELPIEQEIARRLPLWGTPL